MIGSVLRYLLSLPATMRDAQQRCFEMTTFYDQHLMPAVAFDVEPESSLDRALRSAVRGYALRTLFYVQNFTRMAGGDANVEAGLACGMFATIYDTSIDTGLLGPERLPTFIDDLTAGQFADHEDVRMRLMHRLYNGTIRRLLPEEQYVVLYESFHRIHDLQMRSLAQLGRDLAPADLLALTDEKGGVATLLFCAAGKPTFTPAEVAAIMDFGAVLQHVDDLEDSALDRKEGMRTPSTEGVNGPLRLAKEVTRAAHGVRTVWPEPRKATDAFVWGLWTWYLMAVSFQFSPLVVDLIMWMLWPYPAVRELLPNRGQRLSTVSGPARGTISLPSPTNSR